MFTTNPSNTIKSISLGTNNQFGNFPDFMSGGRQFTTYHTEDAINHSIRTGNGIQTNWQYRQFLQGNAMGLVESNFREALREDGYFPYANQIIPDNKTPFMYSSTGQSTIVAPDNRINYPSDLKAIYLSKQQLEARRVAPAMSQEEIMKFVNQRIQSQSTTQK